MKYGAVICSFMFLFSCKTPSGTKNTAMPATPPATSDPARFQRYTGSLYQDNYVWGGAMNLCWTELCESVLKGPLEVQTDDAAALRLADQFNRPVCSKADLAGLVRWGLARCRFQTDRPSIRPIVPKA